MSQIQVIGGNGMLGQAVCHEIRTTGHELVMIPIDIRKVTPNDVRAPVLINCAGLVKQRDAQITDSVAVNQVGPHSLADACDVAHARLLHVSTDCVFSRPGPHTEDDAVDLDDQYAITKYLGEVTRPPHLTVRTSFVGWSVRGLLADLVAQPSIRASRALLWSGHTVQTVAAFLVQLALDREITGLLHMPGTFQSRWSLVQALCHRFALGTLIIDDPTFIADRRLSSVRWHQCGLPDPPRFTTQLAAMEDRR